MKVNWLLATSTGLLNWILIFVVLSIVMFIPTVGNYTNYLSFVFVPILAAICAFLYFRRTDGTILHGVILGVYYLIIGLILDLIVTIPLFVKSYSFFSDWTLWVGYAETIFACVILAWLFRQKTVIIAEPKEVEVIEEIDIIEE